MTLGVAVIGRTPRRDVEERFAALTKTEVLVRGCLDEAPDHLFYPTAEGLTDPLYTPLPDGRTAAISKADVVEGAPKAVARLRKDGARTILFNCTGAFPDFEGSEGVIFPSSLLAALVSAVAPNAPIGLLVPLQEQVATLPAKWPHPERVVAVPVAPSADGAAVAAAAGRLAPLRPAVVVLDCMSYTPHAHAAARSQLDCPIILANRTIGAMLAELAA